MPPVAARYSEGTICRAEKAALAGKAGSGDTQVEANRHVIDFDDFFDCSTIFAVGHICVYPSALQPFREDRTSLRKSRRTRPKL